ncbi:MULTISPECIES: IS110 family RNA-guided transposase [Amycolatopsis]|uniref:Transposase n=1 Tax=Amycolatopsis echigonensis TaxID=2576905 RepID=A0A2N3WQD6_9PSEU|nr:MULTISPECIES: IS110 family transposase [Amycolatopsis]MBB2506308.1 IS110 family transposase [Amycolatopsis echigonensis]PKV91789.1 transposase [Amycolatopsis niigatensis]PKV91792.1 transposase [Amycolatopsis niigatensis]PKV92553.1 transposase [Amycolatopsis niigatensis]PKV96060.1 transposase [Amycolatopsis niigatensis]
MVVIGVDPHKSSHTASALDPQTHRPLETVRIDAALPEYRRLLAWAKQFSERRWAVENARGLGRHLAQWLIARGETVVDVPPTATARVRELSRGGRRKNDALDAAAAASVAALQGDALPVTAEGASTVLGLLDERRLNLTQQRTRTVNQLHALLRDLLPGGVPTDLTADQAAAALTRSRPQSSVERARKDLARELITDIRALDRRLKANKQRMEEAIKDSNSRLTDIAGVGPVVAARLLGRTSLASRFPTAAAFAVYTGVAPIEIASADKARHRLSRQGDRQLNNALHTIALTQVRMHGSRGRLYYDRKIAEGKTHNEAMRCLKRRLADHVWRTMIGDEQRHAPSTPPPLHAAA